jgi:IS30 family transposase
MGVGPLGFCVEQQNLLWVMWRRGDSIREMERTLGETLPRIRRFLRQSGGIPPVPRQRRASHLTLVEREEISRGIAAGLTARSIAGRIGRPSSTVSREIVRNGGRDAYRALAADAAAFQRARRPKMSELAANAELARLVAAKLDDDWSPQQIAQWLRREHPGDADMRVSHESIYRDVYMPSRKAFDASMFHRLRSDRSIRRPLGKRSSCGRGQIRNTVSIRQRPVEADTGEVAGHWEGDLVFGTRTSAVATLVDRATRYAMVVALPDGRKADAVARALIEQMGCLPVHLRRSLTWDRGLEMAHHGRSLRWGPADRLGDKFAELAAVSQSPFKKRMPPCWLRSPTQIFVAVTTAIRARRAHLARHCVQPQPSAVRLTAHGFPVLCPTFGRCRWLASESLAVVPAVPDRLARGRPRSPARSLSAADLVRREVRGGF